MKVVFYPLFLLIFILSCSRDGAEKGAGLQDSLRVAQHSDSAYEGTLRLGDTSQSTSEQVPGGAEVPAGKLPLLHSSVLAQFHPTPTGFYRYRSLAYDTIGRGESVAFFKADDDSMRILRCVIVDQDERTASTLIKQILEIKAKGYRDFEVGGNKVRAQYTEINGTPAVHGYNAALRVATLNILCGDHRLVLFREDKALSTDHLIAVAKTMNLQRLTEMVPQ